MPDITIENLTKKYGDFFALKDFSTVIENGRIIGLLGPNGAGKSTFLRMLTQIYAPTSGQILIDSEPLSPKHRHLFGYLPEEKGLYQDVSLLDQLAYFGEIKGLKPKAAKEKAVFWLEKFDLLKHQKDKTSKLSKGMQQKVQFIASVIQDPQIVVLDEPLSGLDPVNSKVIDEYIRESKQLGRTVIFSTHRMEQAEGVCDNILIINKGQKVLDGSLSAIKKENFNHSYLIKFEDYNQTLKYINDCQQVEVLENKSEVGSFQIKLKAGLSINQLTVELCQISGLQTVQEIYPTINQIFLSHVS